MHSVTMRHFVFGEIVHMFSVLYITRASSDVCHEIRTKGKGKAVTEHHAMKAYWGSGGIALLIL
jgi:hypothetical protein